MATSELIKDDLQQVSATGAAGLEAFFRKNLKTIIIALVALAVIVGGYFAWRWYQNSQNDQAAEQIGFAIREFEGGRFRQALDGTAGKPGLLKIADSFGSTETGNLAKFYAAAALDNLNDRKKALSYYEAYDKGENFLGAAAYAAQASITEDLNKDYAKAADLYKEAANTSQDEAVAPEYLRKAARNYELSKNYDSARNMFNLIKEKYPKSAAAANLDYDLGRLEVLAGKK